MLGVQYAHAHIYLHLFLLFNFYFHMSIELCLRLLLFRFYTPLRSHSNFSTKPIETDPNSGRDMMCVECAHARKQTHVNLTIKECKITWATTTHVNSNRLWSHMYIYIFLFKIRLLRLSKCEHCQQLAPIHANTVHSM